jgi:hypothetical protein
MKINRFNESIKIATDKILKISIEDFEVNINEIEKTDRYQKEFDYMYDKSGDKVRARKRAIYYGIEEWIYREGNINIKYELVDGLGNTIEDEEKFDEYVKNIGKYNV